MLELRYYVSGAGAEVVTEWLSGLRDRKAVTKIATRIARLALGNFGDCKSVGGGVFELRIDWGPGYRVYCSRLGNTVVLLLCGGDKATQHKDIENAKTYFDDYKARAKSSNPTKPAV